jgi:cellulose synthase/poly-beta-1,6-N-acetylglucosamine synthase-like glycosyltransferase
MSPLASVVIPAHNEERGIARNLAELHRGLAPESLDVVVVCNGCTDDTAARAREALPTARVIELPAPSKAAAVRVGNAATDVFPRVHLDADVRLSGADLQRLVRPLLDGDVLATAPRRVLSLDRSSRVVRWYYEVWEQLPQVQAGLFGRGAYALSAAGQRRVSALPDLMSDDLAMSDAFDASEREVVRDAEVAVVAPQNLRDLVRRRVRVTTGNAQASSYGVRRVDSRTHPATLLRLALTRPRLAVRLPVFVAVAAVARVLSLRAVRSGDFTTWLRDESSRT